MPQTALTRPGQVCARCQEPIPHPLKVCLRCGGAPLYAAPSDSGYSVELSPVPSMQMRKDIAQVCAQLFNGVDARAMEKRLAEGNPPVWLAGGLSEESAKSLVDRFRAMHAPARVVPGDLARPKLAAVVLNTWTGAILVAGIVVGLIWAPWLIAVFAVAAVAAGYALHQRRGGSGPIGRAELALDHDTELNAQLRQAMSVRPRLTADVAQTFDRVTSSVRDVLLRLSSEDDAIGYVAGGTTGAIGHEAIQVLDAAGHVGDRLALSGSDPGRAASLKGALDALAATAAEVRDDLAALAQDPDAEPDLAGRLDQNASKLSAAAGQARSL